MAILHYVLESHNGFNSSNWYFLEILNVSIRSVFQNQVTNAYILNFSCHWTGQVATDSQVIIIRKAQAGDYFQSL